MRKINAGSFKKYLNQEIIDSLIFLNAKGILNDLIICGSLGLVLNDRLKRSVKDIDFLTIPNWYGYDNPLQTYRNNDGNRVSHQFNVDNKKITCWKIKIFDTKIDLLYNSSDNIDYEEVELLFPDEWKAEGFKLTVKIENAESAIAFKKKYIIADKSEESRKKHLADIDAMFNNSFLETKEVVYESNTISAVDDLPF